MAGPVLAAAGRRVDAPDAAQPRFGAGDVPVVARRIREVLEELRPREIIASAAAGVDLLVLDEACALGIPFRVLLPFDRARFRASSVADRGESWTARYDDVLGAAAQIEIVDTGGADDDAAYAAVTRSIVERARSADRRGAVALGVWDLVSRGASDQSETFVRYARERGLRVVEVTTRSEDQLPWDRTVFVAMPFGTKTVGSVTVDFDRAYDAILKPAIQSAGTPGGLPFFPTRADKGFYSGIIDEIMYRRLESSRMCVADITSLNTNVIFELGIRYGARPSATIVLRQDATTLPFDLGHVRVFSYDASDEPAARETIARIIDESARVDVVDSPVRAAIAASLPASHQHRGFGAELRDDAVVPALMREAEQALAQGDENVALERYEKVLDRLDDPEVRVRAATLCNRLERLPEAIRHCEAAIRLDPGSGPAYRERGIALERSAPGSGIASLQKAVELSRNDYDAWASLGGALRRAGKDAAALAAYERAIELSNGNPYPLLNALKLKKLAGISPGARDEVMLRAAARIRAAQVEAKPPRDTPWSFFDLAEIQLHLGNGAEAERLLHEGAGFARPKQLRSHRDAIARVAAVAPEPGWAAAVAFLDRLLGERSDPTS